MGSFVSRAGAKLDHALSFFQIDVRGKTCADLGCSTGGFVDCLLQRGAAKVFAVDTGYGVLDWTLRKDPRVAVQERTNAMHVELECKVDLVTIDVGWTKQKHILPRAALLLGEGGLIVTLIKPHYEAEPSLLRQGILPESAIAVVVETVRAEVMAMGLDWVESVPSPILGSGGNAEMLALVRPPV